MTTGCNFVFRLTDGTILTVYGTNRCNFMLSADGILTEKLEAIQQYINQVKAIYGDISASISTDSLLMVIDYQTHTKYGYKIAPYTSVESCSYYNYLQWAKGKEPDRDDLDSLISLYRSNRITKIVCESCGFNNRTKTEIPIPYTNESEFIAFLERTSKRNRGYEIDGDYGFDTFEIFFDTSPFKSEYFNDKMGIYQRLKEIGFNVDIKLFSNEE